AEAEEQETRLFAGEVAERDPRRERVGAELARARKRSGVLSLLPERGGGCVVSQNVEVRTAAAAAGRDQRFGPPRRRARDALPRRDDGDLTSAPGRGAEVVGEGVAIERRAIVLLAAGRVTRQDLAVAGQRHEVRTRRPDRFRIARSAQESPSG